MTYLGMSYLVAITDRAFEELNVACQWWTDHRSADQALRWYNGFIRSIRGLAKNPERYPLAAEDGAFTYEIRQLNYGLGRRPSHRAIFTIRPDMVLVVRIRHLAQGEIDPDD